MSNQKILLSCGKVYCLNVENQDGGKDKKIVQVLSVVNSNHFTVWDTIRGCVYVVNSDKIRSKKEVRIIKNELLESDKLKKSYS